MEENTSKAYVDSGPELLRASSVEASGTGSPLFIINLCASQAPAQLAGKTLPGLEAYRLYQVSRVEDGRTRYRLRIGFFASEGAANEVLAKVRADYPTAFTTCLTDEDRKFARGYLPDAAPVARPRPVAVVNRPSAPPATPVVAKAATATSPPAAKAIPATPAKAPIPTAPTQRAPVTDTQSMKKIDLALEESAGVEMTWAPEPAPREIDQKRTAQTSSTPAKLTGSHKALDESSIDEIELSWDPPALQTAPRAQKEARAPAAPKPAVPATAAAAVKATVAPGKAASPVAAQEIKNPPITLKASAPVNLELESDPPAAPASKQPTATAAAQPFHVGKGVDIPNVSLSLQAEAAPIVVPTAAAPARPAASTPTPSTAKPAAAKPAVGKAQSKVTAPAARTEPPKSQAPAKQPAAAPAPQARPGVQLPSRVSALPDLDSTQTIRALTDDELNDGAIDKWFSIQLAVSEQPVNLDAMPHLDIFEAYRLYSIANAGSGKIVHSLRLGFFREAVSAEAVAGYLKTFFAATSVLRISSAEHLRFKDAPAPKKPAPAPMETKDKVVDLNQARDRAARPVIPTVTMEVVPQRSGATGTHKALNPSATGAHKALNPTLKPAAKAAAKTTGAATKRSAPIKSSGSVTGRYRAPTKMSLQEQLLEEAREVELSESGMRPLPKNDSLLARLVDKLKK